MTDDFKWPRVGVGVYIRRDGKVLMGKRKSSHATGTWCTPGGKLEYGESPEECAVRETREECGVEMENVRVYTITNDLFPESGQHWITIALVADWGSGEGELLEPDKFEEWGWFAWDALPEPLILSARNFIKAGYNPFTY